MTRQNCIKVVKYALIVKQVNSEYTPLPSTSSSPRLRRAIDFLLAYPVSDISVTGLDEQRAELAKDSSIVLTSHRTGLDVPIAIKALGGMLDLVVTDQSTHHHMSDVAGWVGMKVAGEENFIPVDYVHGPKVSNPGMFRPGDVEPAVNAMQEGKSVLVAAYNPLVRGEKTATKPGYGAAYLSLLTGAPILPVGIQYNRKHPLDRTHANVVVGQRYELPAQPEVASLKDIVNKRTKDELTIDDIRELSNDLKIIRSRGKQMFETVLKLEQRAR